MKYQDWIARANVAINQAVATCFNNYRLGGWNENHITTEVLAAVERIGREIDWEDRPQKVKWEAHKLSGTKEYTFGDIAVLARVWLTGERYLDGVAFYEAKRQYFGKSGTATGFSSINLEQLSRIGAKTNSSHVVLYDADAEKNQVCVTAVPTAFVQELAAANLVPVTGRLIHRYGNIWVTSLGDNLRGFGLDFRREAVAAVKSAAASEDAPLVILSLGIAMNKMLEPVLDRYCTSLSHYEPWFVESVDHGHRPSHDDERDFDM